MIFSDLDSILTYLSSNAFVCPKRVATLYAVCERNTHETLRKRFE